MDCPRSEIEGPFEDVPETLTRWVRGIPESLSEPARDIMAAGFLIAYYLRPELLDEKEDRFLSAAEAVPEWHAGSRLVSVAEALFVLRDHSGFAQWCDQSRKKGLRSIFFEASGARRFAQAGFEIASLEGPRGGAGNWGFNARRGGDRINVLVLGLEAQRFSAAAIRRSLSQAAEILPDNAPSFLCCYYPPRWVLDCWDLDFSLGQAAEEFLAGSGKINQLGFYREAFAELEEGKAHFICGFVERNPSPARPSAAIDRVTGRPNGGKMPGSGPASGQGTPKFREWVNWALASGH